MYFFGVIIDIVEFKVYPTTENIDKIKNLYVPILEKQTVPIRKVASLIGLIVHAFTAVTYGQLYYRNLEKDKITNLRLDNDDYNENGNYGDFRNHYM